MGFIQEFKEFAVKGNMIDMAVGIIVGAEFTKIVNSLVTDVIMPPIGLLLGRVDFKNIFFILKDGVTDTGPYNTLLDAQKAGAVTLNIGLFTMALISFTIVAFSIFAMVKGVNKLRKTL